MAIFDPRQGQNSKAKQDEEAYVGGMYIQSRGGQVGKTISADGCLWWGLLTKFQGRHRRAASLE